ncbi:hypothetical protein [Caballeronia telluris]|uniref:Bacteriophage protein n=1 Tax=Caballeronia telluris TaxID=326475 RepID=A0A158G1R4_9BURK|nr:hypothetical protein [Caballeronia telluris]SAL25781.1 putative bacteriophage protein [Caballeronia telluris]
MSVKITRDKLQEVLRSMNALVKKDVLVGIPDSAPERRDTPVTNAQIGYILDRGSPAKNIPARPWLVPGVEEVQSECAERLKKGATAALSGNQQGVDSALTAAGLTAEMGVKAKINSNIQPKLADSTLAARRARGVTRENTLVDTGSLRNSVTHVIREKK